MRIRLIGVLRNLAGRDSLEIAVQEDRTVAQIIEKLVNLVGRSEFAAAILDRELNNPTANTLIMVNSKDISALDGVKTRLKNTDEIVLIPISHGG